MSAVVNSVQLFASPSAVAAFDATRTPNLAQARCGVVNDEYQLVLAPSAALLAAADGVNVIAATLPVGAVWCRSFVRNIPAEYEPAWFIDTAGNDGNTGTTVGAPLRTLRELGYRLRGATLRQDVTVTVTAGNFSADPLILDLECQSFSILILGNVTSTAGDVVLVALPTVVGAAGTNVGAQRYTITATALAFTDKERIRCTVGAIAGTTGNWSWVTRVVTPGVGGVANTAHWGSLANVRTNTSLGTLLEPAALDTYVLDTLNTTFGRLELRAHGRGRIIVQDVILTVNVSGDGHYVAGDNSNANGVLLYGCKFSDTTTLISSDGTGWTAVGCQFASTTTVFLEGTHVPRNCVFTGTVQTAATGCIVQQNNACCFDGAFLQLIFGTWDYGSGAPNNDIQWVDGTTGNGLEINPKASLQGHGGTTNAWGLNNAFTGVFARLFAFGVWTYATKPSVPGGTGNDANVGGTVKLWAAIPFQQVEGNGGSAAIITL